MKKKNIVVFGILVIVVTAVAYFYFKSRKPQLTYQTGRVDRGDIQVAVTATGKLSPLMQVQVGTQVSGIVSKIYADFNTQVKKGQVIAEIDKTALMTSVQDARANVDKARIQADQARREYQRQKQLFEEKVIAKMDLETAEVTYRSAVSTLSSMESQLNRALANLKYATIVAPIDGIVVSRSVDVGQTVAASFNTPTLFTIANDLTKMQVEASVDEADIGNIKVKQPVTFTVDAFPNETFPGIVKQIRLQPTITQNVVTYSVIVEVANPDQKLLPGMTANINIILDKHDNVLKVPTGALRFMPDPEVMKDLMKFVPDSVRQKFKENRGKKVGQGRTMQRTFSPGSQGRVWLKKGDTLQPVRVTVGISDGGTTEVTGPLKEEDEVVLSIVKEDKTAASGQQGQNPFAPKMPSRGQGGGRRGM